MIIVNLKGGIGNQLFQYALGRHLSIMNKTDLRLDIHGFKSYKWHNYSLQLFSINEVFFPHNIKNLLYLHFHKWKDNHATGNKKFRITEETLQPFDPAVLNAGSNLYLDGYWQSEKYFKDIRQVLLKDLMITRDFNSINGKISSSITSSNSVSVHIRRGNYVANPRVNEVHGTCTQEYYDKSAEYILQKVQDAHFFIFSDEIEWAKANFKINARHTFVDNNKGFDGENYQDEKNVDDLRLMSLCRHNIIANSSFSWWGAWLNENPEKIVIAPGKWFNDPKMDTVDLIPENWVRL
jgi:hypothetical protein